MLNLPGGAWRTRHLRLRSTGLREKLPLRHLPGGLLVADHLTKPINPRPKWSHFFKFMGMVVRGEKDGGSLIPVDGADPQSADAGAGAGRGRAAKGKGKGKGKAHGVFRRGQGSTALPFARDRPPVVLRSRQEVQARAAVDETSSEGAEGSEVSGSVSDGGTYRLRERRVPEPSNVQMDVVEEEEIVAADVPTDSVQGGGGDEGAEEEVPTPEAGLPAASSAEIPDPGHAVNLKDIHGLKGFVFLTHQSLT